MEGWIKIHRKITEWEWFSDTPTRDVFIYLILKANHKAGKWKGINVDRGEYITGRKELAKKLGFGEQQVRSALTKLKSTNEITIKTTNKFSLIKINNYNDYQLDNQQLNQQVTNNQPTNNQQVTTNKNNKNNKNEKKYNENQNFQKKQYDPDKKCPYCYGYGKHENWCTYANSKK